MRYYFHIFDDLVSLDEEGQLLPNLSSAEAVAIRGARELACEQIRTGYLNFDHYIVVADEHGRELSRVHFSEAFIPLKTS